MGKKRHAKDRAYITATEHKEEWGGYKAAVHHKFKQLPYFCCALTFTPFEDPVATDDGFVFEIVHVIPYIKKFQKHPVSGDPLSVKDLTKLTFHKNGEDQYCCPVLGKAFTDSTHIVANKGELLHLLGQQGRQWSLSIDIVRLGGTQKSGHVYSMQAIEELNIKAKNWKDLITDEPFTRKDLLVIQDPQNLAKRELSKFEHVVKGLEVPRPEEPAFSNINAAASSETMKVLQELGTDSAKAAFNAGGGGTKAAAERILAAAKQAEKAAKEARKEAAAPAAARGEVPTAPDSILVNPNLLRAGVSFKPGAVTWNTDDPARDRAIHGGGHGKKRKSKKEGSPDASGAGAGFGLVPVAPSATKGIYLKKNEMRTTGASSRAFTSSTWEPATVNERAVERVEKNPKKKGYVQIHTTLGDVNLELHCDICPRTCENFLALCETGYYNNVAFHRSIKNFMIQGGDPKGDGTGGQSIWQQPFRDEFDSRLTHDGRGVLSMANSGPNTNGSQFFILYKSAKHLDHKHTVFGKVVGGFEVLTAMERIPVDDRDKPKQDIRITKVTIYVNPYSEEEEEEAVEEPDEEAEQVGQWFSNPQVNDLTVQRAGVGKYLQTATARPIAVAATTADTADIPAPAKKPKPVSGASFGNFDAW